MLDLHQAATGGALARVAPGVQVALLSPTLNPLMAQGRAASKSLRRAVHGLLRADSTRTRRDPALLVPMDEAELLMPADIGDYTDEFARTERHAHARTHLHAADPNAVGRAIVEQSSQRHGQGHTQDGVVGGHRVQSKRATQAT